MNKLKYRLIIILFFLFIAIFSCSLLFSHKRDISIQENRTLQTMPDFNIESIVDGSAMSSFEKYISDHFPLRDEWVTAKARFEYAFGKRVSNNVYYGKDGQLFPAFEEPDKSSLDQKIYWLNSFKDKTTIPVYFTLIPGASSVQADRLPKFTPADKQKDVIDYCYSNISLSTIDLFSTLSEHKNEKIYYYTDHHWTSYGALIAYQELSNVINDGESFNGKEHNYNVVDMSDSFYGTLYSSSGYTWVAPDTISKYVDDNNIVIKSYINGVNSDPIEHGLYFDEYLNNKDKYQYYLGGISPLIQLSNQSAGSSSLMIIRDSYSDSLAPFLAQDYSDIYILDLRYYKDSINDFINDHSIDQILIIYSVSNFCDDNNLGLLLG